MTDKCIWHRYHKLNHMLLFQQTFKLIGSYLYFKTKAEAVDKIKIVAWRRGLTLREVILSEIKLYIDQIYIKISTNGNPL